MRKILSILSVCAIAVSAMAMPARREGMLRKDANGTEKVVYLHGNAFYHYMTDANGNWLDEETLAPLSAEAKAQKQQRGEARMKARRVQQKKMIGTEPNIAPRGLLIMVNFKNKSFVTPRDTIDSMMNGTNFTRKYKLNYTYSDDYGQSYRINQSISASGSARQYFQDQSFGQYNPQFDVVGPYTLSQNYSYYGRNDDENVGYMIKEACELADADGVDFTQYDNNNDGKVDFVYVLYAGEGEADGGSSTTVWPHNYSLEYYEEYGFSDIACKVDGKKVANYACSNEWQHYGQVYNGIGTICHEFSHVMGLPDLYETNQNSLGLHTLLDWDILDYGPYNNDGNTPPSYSAYERFFCGWITPRVLKDPENVTLKPINSSQEALLMCSGDAHNLVGWNPNPKTFYLLEARNQSGWDKYLPGKGMLITKITYNATKWDENTVNNSRTNMGVDLIEAKANISDASAATDAFPAGAKSYVSFTGHEITNISRVSAGTNIGTITFLYRGGSPEGIESVQPSEVSYQKILREGKVVIIREGKEYDILGNRL